VAVSGYQGVEVAMEKQIDISSLAGNILIAEDTKDIRVLMTYYFESTSAKITFANNGEEAVNFAKYNQYDLILMDIQMPVLDGLSATREIRDSGFKKPIVALTANVMKEDQECYKASGLDAFIAKPIDTIELYKVLEFYLPKRKGESINEADKLEKKRQTKLRLASAFRERLPDWLSDISLGIREKNSDELSRVAHVLKGLGGSFGYPEITEMSANIELLGKKSDFENAAICFGELEAFCKDII